MKPISFADTFNHYLQGLGGPPFENERETQLELCVPSATKTADKVARQLDAFAREVNQVTNDRFRGWLATAHNAGRRDALFAIPGRANRSETGDPVRPPFVYRLVQVGYLAIDEARGVA